MFKFKELTTKETKKLFIRVFDEHIDNIVNDLTLKRRPEYKFVDDNNDFVMATGGTFECTGFFPKIIAKSNADYILKINIKALKRMLIKYRLLFGKKSMTDIVVVLLLHECRHMWQYQGTFFIGKEYNDLNASKTSSLYVHGYVEEEMDANEYACYSAKTKGSGIFALSFVMKAEQENYKGIKEAFLTAKKEYSSPMKLAISIIGIASAVISIALIIKKIAKNERSH